MGVAPLLLSLVILLVALVQVNGFVGGKNATMKEISHIISMRNILRDSQVFGAGHYCGGAVYNHHAFLTSASCLGDSVGDKFMHAGFMRIVGGTLNKDLMEDKTFAANGDKIKPHPGYNFRTRAFNLAFIKVANGIPSKGFNLKNITVAKKTPKIGAKCKITGWGKVGSESTDLVYPIPQVAEVELLPMEKCEKVYQAIPQNTLCFGSAGVSACLEDSGTVIFCDGHAVGIIALMDSCQKNQHLHPFVATSVPDFSEWIMENGSQRDFSVSLILELYLGLWVLGELIYY